MQEVIEFIENEIKEKKKQLDIVERELGALENSLKILKFTRFTEPPEKRKATTTSSSKKKASKKPGESLLKLRDFAEKNELFQVKEAVRAVGNKYAGNLLKNNPDIATPVNEADDGRVYLYKSLIYKAPKTQMNEDAEGTPEQPIAREGGTLFRR